MAASTGGEHECRGWFAALALGVTLLKCLFVEAYHSTDFEVHRNWLAITHGLPLSRWYRESTHSEWTLDYPPLFAWFECALSQLARLVDADMLSLDRPGYASPAAVLFQRLSVVAADLLFVYAVGECCGSVREEGERLPLLSRPPFVLATLLLWNAGLLLLDHVHFQYNGFLSAFLLLSLARHAQSRHLEGALLFATLLNLKHVYLYVSPAYGVYLLRRYCFTDDEVRWESFSPRRLAALASVVLAVTAVSFGPFAATGQMPQVLSRLFPFERGLCHAYWAPNFWALYNALDKVLAGVGARLGLLDASGLPTASMTGGLVGRESQRHAVLPSVSPGAALALTLLSVLPAVLRTWRKKPGAAAAGGRDLVRCVVLCALGSFMFAWHVHEKAVLMAVLPLSVLAVESREDAGAFLVLATAGNYSLSPLLFTPAELPLKTLLLATFTVYSVAALTRLHAGQGPVLGPPERAYLSGLFAVEVLREIVYPLSRWQRTLPFVPLLVTSVYCSLGITYSFVRLYLRYLLE